jgi:hypothetical protein
MDVPTTTKGTTMDEYDDLIRECGADLPEDREPDLNEDERVTQEIMDTLDELTMGLVS